jgi:hypothetical protein
VGSREGWVLKVRTMQKTVSRILLPFVSLFLLMLPIRQAQAIVPLVMAATTISRIALTTPLGQQLLIAAPLGIGAAIYAMQITRGDGSNTRDDNIYFTTQPRPPSAVEAAAGWTKSTTGLQPSPPSSTSAVSGWQFSGIWASFGAYPSKEALADAKVAANYPGGSYVFTGGPFTSGSYVYYNVSFKSSTGATVATAQTWNNATTCPTGYTVSGSSCVLSNASIVQKPTDNICSIARSGNEYAVDTTDPDCANGQAPTLNPTTAGGGMAVIPSSNGNSVSVTYSPDGSVQIKSAVADPATNTTKTKIIGLRPPSDLTQPTELTGLFVDSVTEVLDNGIGTAAGASPITTTSDPAVAAQLAAIQDELSAKGSTAALPTVAGAAGVAAYYDNNVEAQNITDIMGGSTLPLLPVWLFPSFTAPSCQPIGWTWQGHTISFDLCPWVPTIKSIEAWILNLIAAAMLFQMVMNFRAMRVTGR